MDNLILVIGPAPSEMEEGEFLLKLREERQRASRALHAYREMQFAPKPKAKAKKAKPSSKKKVSKAKLGSLLEEKLAEQGITAEEFLKGGK